MSNLSLELHQILTDRGMTAKKLDIDKEKWDTIYAKLARQCMIVHFLKLTDFKSFGASHGHDVIQ